MSEPPTSTPPTADSASTDAEANAPSAPTSGWRQRDPNIAIRQEFDIAVQAGTKDALELFIARYPDHALAEDARQRLRDLEARPSND